MSLIVCFLNVSLTLSSQVGLHMHSLTNVLEVGGMLAIFLYTYIGLGMSCDQ